MNLKWHIDSNVSRARSDMKLVLLDHFCFWLFTGRLLKLCYGDRIDLVMQAENSMVYLLMTREIASGEGLACV